MRIILRHEWGARYPDGFRDAPLPAREVWLHHTAGPAYNGAGIIRDLERVGQERFGGGMSYSFLITINGDIYEGHSIHRLGAHTGGRNDIARAICYVGNYETTRPSEAQLNSTAWLLREGKRRSWWREAHLTGGHRDLKATACPGGHAYRLIHEINRRAAISPAPAPPQSKEDIMASLDDLRRVLDEKVMWAPRPRQGESQDPDTTISLASMLSWWDHAMVLDRQATIDAEKRIMARLDEIEARLDAGGGESPKAT